MIGCITLVATSPRRLAWGSALFHLTSYRIRTDQAMYLLTSPAAAPGLLDSRLWSGSPYIGGVSILLFASLHSHYDWRRMPQTKQLHG